MASQAMAVVATTAYMSTTFCGYRGITASRVRFIIGGRFEYDSRNELPPGLLVCGLLPHGFLSSLQLGR
jgi:hypothetical protein